MCMDTERDAMSDKAKEFERTVGPSSETGGRCYNIETYTQRNADSQCQRRENG